MEFTDPSFAPPEAAVSETATDARGRWTGCAVLVLMLMLQLAFIAWDFMPIITLGPRGKTIQRELVSGMPIADARRLLSSRGLRFTLLKETTGMVRWKFYGVPAMLTTGTAVLHVYLLPRTLTYTERALLKLADQLPQNANETIRAFIDNQDDELRRHGRPTSFSYAVTSGTIGRRLD